MKYIFAFFVSQLNLKNIQVYSILCTLEREEEKIKTKIVIALNLSRQNQGGSLHLHTYANASSHPASYFAYTDK